MREPTSSNPNFATLKAFLNCHAYCALFTSCRKRVLGLLGESQVSSISLLLLHPAKCDRPLFFHCSTKGRALNSGENDHQFGLYNDNEAFSVVPKKVVTQPQTGSLEKSWCVREENDALHVHMSQGPRHGRRISQGATWHIPLEQWIIAECRAAETSTSSLTTTHNPYLATLLFFNARNSSAVTAPGDVTREVILKVMKNVKGNEEILWSEMRALQGLDHLNIPSFLHHRPCSLAMVTCLVVLL